ncbi:hypothetical protein ACFLYU_03235 [Candidatus Dependentiae bacterium]
MIEHNIDFQENENQLVISFELICLLKWILENEDHKMKKIIEKALHSGLKEELNKKALLSKELMLDDIQMVLLDFFDMMETLLIDSLGQHAIKKVLEKKLMPSIDQIDSSVCDDATIRFSIEKAASKLEKNPQENFTPENDSIENNSPENNNQKNAKNILMEELLKRWKPRNKNMLN